MWATAASPGAGGYGWTPGAASRPDMVRCHWRTPYRRNGFGPRRCNLMTPSGLAGPAVAVAPTRTTRARSPREIRAVRCLGRVGASARGIIASVLCRNAPAEKNGRQLFPAFVCWPAALSRAFWRISSKNVRQPSALPSTWSSYFRYTARALRPAAAVSDRTGLRSAAAVRRLAWSVTQTRNMGWHAFFRRSMIRLGASSK